MKASLKYEVLERPRAGYLRRGLLSYRVQRRQERVVVRREIEEGIAESRDTTDEESDTAHLRVSGSGRRSMAPRSGDRFNGVKELRDFLTPMYGVLLKAAREGTSWSLLKAEFSRVLGHTYAHRHILTEHVLYSVHEDVIGQTEDGEWLDSKNRVIWGSERYPVFAVVDDRLVLCVRSHTKEVIEKRTKGLHPDTIIDSFVRAADGSPLTGYARTRVARIFYGETLDVAPPEMFVNRAKEAKKKHFRLLSRHRGPYDNWYYYQKLSDFAKLLAGFDASVSNEQSKEDRKWVRVVGYEANYAQVVDGLVEEIKRRPGLSVLVRTKPFEWSHIKTGNLRKVSKFFVVLSYTGWSRVSADYGALRELSYDAHVCKYDAHVCKYDAHVRNLEVDKRIEYSTLTATVTPSKFQLKDSWRKVPKSAYKKGTLSER